MNLITNKTKRKKIFLFIAAGIILLGATAYAIYFFEYKNRSDYVFVQVRATQNAGGWGYEILTDGKVYIKQDFIPAIPGRHSFETKEQALLVGNKVLDKIEHKQMPVITFAELKQMNIIKDPVSAK
jgi:predicted signal transduction protein with EAL and GGDEF domain